MSESASFQTTEEKALAALASARKPVSLELLSQQARVSVEELRQVLEKPEHESKFTLDSDGNVEPTEDYRQSVQSVGLDGQADSFVLDNILPPNIGKSGLGE